MVMKNGKKNFRKASGVFILISVILIAVNQLLRDPEKYDTVTPSPAVQELSVCVGDSLNKAYRYYDSSKTAKENHDYCEKNRLPDVVCDVINGKTIKLPFGKTTLSCPSIDNPNKAWNAGSSLSTIGGSYIRCDNKVTTGTTGGGLLIAGANQKVAGFFSVGDIVNEQVNDYCNNSQGNKPKNPMTVGPPCNLKSLTVEPACPPRGCGYETKDRICDTRATFEKGKKIRPKDNHCSICKYGWRTETLGHDGPEGDDLRTHCCTEAEAQPGDNSYNCIMTCSNSSCKYTKNCDNSSFPKDACPEKNRGVMCDTRLGYDPHCSFCDLGYKGKGLNDWCCTEADFTESGVFSSKNPQGCIQTCKNKCSGSPGITGCPYYSRDDCP